MPVRERASATTRFGDPGDLGARGLFAAVWLVNGLWCKLLDGTPRHRAIVARILGDDLAALITHLIGLGEIALALWIVVGLHRRATAILQIALVLTMNVVEFAVAPDLLLFGRFNLLVAFAFCGLVAAVELRPRTTRARVTPRFAE